MSDWDPRNPFGRGYDLNTHWEQKAKAKIIEENLKAKIANHPNGCINDNDLRDPQVRFVFSMAFGFIRAPKPLAEESSAAKLSAAIPIIDPVTGQEIKVGTPRVPPHMRHLKPTAGSSTAGSGHASVSTTDEQMKLSTSVVDPPKGDPHMSKPTAGASTFNSGHANGPTTDPHIKVGTPVINPPKIYPHLRGIKPVGDYAAIDSGYMSTSVVDPLKIHPHLRGIKPVADSVVDSGHASTSAVNLPKIHPHLRGIKPAADSSTANSGHATVPTADQHIKVDTKIHPHLRGIKPAVELSAVISGHTTAPTTDQHIKVSKSIAEPLKIHPHLRGIKSAAELSAVCSGHTTIPKADQHINIGTKTHHHLRGIKAATDSSIANSGHTRILTTERDVQTEAPVAHPANSMPNSVQHSKLAGAPSTPGFRRILNSTTDAEFVSPSPDGPKAISSPPTTTPLVSASSATTSLVSSSNSTAPTTAMTIEEARLRYPPHMVAILFPKPKEDATSVALTSPNPLETLSIRYQAQVCKSAEPQNPTSVKAISSFSDNSNPKAISNILEAPNPIASKAVSNISGTSKHAASKTTSMVSKPKPAASKTASKYSKYSKILKPVAAKVSHLQNLSLLS